GQFIRVAETVTRTSTVLFATSNNGQKLSASDRNHPPDAFASVRRRPAVVILSSIHTITSATSRVRRALARAVLYPAHPQPKNSSPRRPRRYPSMSSGKWWVLTFVLTVALTAGVGWYFLSKTPPSVRADDDERPAGKAAAVHVEVVRPQMGGMDRTTEQPGTVIAYESASLYAEVPGYLKKQNVDIGSRVTKGQVLAEIAVPELDAQVHRCAAAVDQAKAHVDVMKARVRSAEADLKVAKAGVVTAEAAAKSKKALRTLAETELKQAEGLFATKSIEQVVVYVAQEKADAAVETERAAPAAIPSAEGVVAASAAKVEQAEADVLDAEAAVKVAAADLEKAQVMVKFATIVSNYDGVIAQRNYFPHDFIKSANQGSQLPLFVVERTDKMRVVVQVPDRDVPYTDPGDEAVVEIDALPGQQFKGTVARMASSEDPQTRLMRTEIDL